jgi:hypothetical protein
MKDINQLPIDKQLALINSDVFYYCYIKNKPYDDSNGYKVGDNYVSLNRFKIKEFGNGFHILPNPYNPFYFYDSIKNKSEEFQIEFIKSIKYSKIYNYDFLVEKYITSDKAVKLYNKIKKVNRIIK